MKHKEKTDLWEQRNVERTELDCFLNWRLVGWVGFGTGEHRAVWPILARVLTGSYFILCCSGPTGPFPWKGLGLLSGFLTFDKRKDRLSRSGYFSIDTICSAIAFLYKRFHHDSTLSKAGLYILSNRWARRRTCTKFRHSTVSQQDSEPHRQLRTFYPFGVCFYPGKRMAFVITFQKVFNEPRNTGLWRVRTRTGTEGRFINKWSVACDLK